MITPTIDQIQNNILKYCNSRNMKLYYPKFYIYIESHYTGATFSEKLYQYFYGQHVCPICGVPTSFQGFKRGYRTYCSYDCMYKDKTIQNKIELTNLKRYGVKRASQNKIIKNKISKSNKITQNKQEVKERIKKTNLIKYGVEKYTNRDKCRESMKIKNLNERDYLIGYTNEGEWICKCPHSDTCNKCKEKFYISKSSIQYDRTRNNCELCTKLFPIGSKETGVSNSSKLYFSQLKEYFPDLITEYPLGKYKLDCYIPSLKIDIEYNGIYWHAKPTIYNPDDVLNFYGAHKTAQEIWDHDRERKKYIESKSIKVIVVWEDELPEPKNLRDTITNKCS